MTRAQKTPFSSFANGNHFFADSSRVRPVQSETLRFMCKQIGLNTVRLDERFPHPSMGLTEDFPEGPTRRAVTGLLEREFVVENYVVVAAK
jgi:hypothetical protein